MKNIAKALVKTLILLAITAAFLLLSKSLFASEVVNIPILADSIRLAEGVNSRHPYGILKKYKTTTPRQACINTIKSGLKRYQTDTKGLEFIPFLAQTYCPIGAKNDPTGLNRHWVKNVSFFYARLLAKKEATLKKFNDNANYRL
jgi:hypothetical protein